MVYFKRSIPKQNFVSKTIEDIDSTLNSFYENKNEEDELIRLHSSTLGKDELIAFSKAYLEGNITVGKYNQQYEKMATEYFSSKYCVTSNSGSSANLLAISALVQSGKIRKGDKVAVPALAWSTTVFPLVQYGLIPVFIDISENDFNLSLNDLEECVKEHDIKAVMIIHTYGNPVDLDFLVNFCISKKLILIEDTCESMGALWNNKPVGSFGIAGTFSSYFSHHICTLEGGLTISNDAELNNYMKSIRSHGWTRGIEFDSELIKNIDRLDPTFLFINVGYNLRLSDPQAAMGCIQLSKLDQFVKSRIINAEQFKKRISNSSILSKSISTQNVNAKAKSSWFGFPILFNNLDRSQVLLLRSKLLEKGIESRPFLAGDFSQQPVNSKYKSIKYLKSNIIQKFHEFSFALPCHQSLKLGDIDFMCTTLEDSLIEILEK